MRLIDAYKLIDYFYYGIDDKPIIDGISDRKIIDIIKNQPTAYDIDKVVKELEEMKMRYFLTIANTGDEKSDFAYENVGNALDKAIEIVKHGVVSDDVCEWKRDDTFRGMQAYKAGCCNKILDLTVRMALEMNQCPYCGKKIKVV